MPSHLDDVNQVNHSKHVKLFIPGPTEVRPDVLAEMARPIISHRSAEMAAMQRKISQQAAAIMFTANPVLLST